ncbi:beta family protein [Streptomyces lydicus]|uniref:beta family protein n=1 Tax=Streptomyces lydicus TaxID=47763 RepID=UPI003796F321
MLQLVECVLCLGEPVAYVPILKGKAGEFLALGHASAEVQSQIRPVMEVVPDCDVRDLLETFCDRAMEDVPNGMVLTVDCGALPAAQVLKGDAGGPMVRLGESLSWRQVAMCPVFRGTDTDETLAEVRAVMAWHQQGGCLRISSARDAQECRPDEERVREMLRTLRAAPEEIDLIIDAGPVHSRDGRAALAVEVLDTLKHMTQWPWRHECVAAGAFPVNLTNFPRGRATPVVREDALLWKQVRDQWRGEVPDFGDFGVTHPRMPLQARGAPHPNMRYTTAADWQVFVYPKTRPGNDDFFTLSRDLVSSPYWPPTGAGTSWGDARLEECAKRQRAKAGGGTEWRAWATSHHLAVVSSRLTALGCP